MGDSAKSEWRMFWRVFAFGFSLLLVVLVLAPTRLGPLFRIFSIPSRSMAPNFPKGSYVVISHMSYGYARASFDFVDLPISGRWPSLGLPKRGDVVVFRSPHDQKTAFLKRIVGLPGDKVQIIAGRLWLNGEQVPREPAGQIADPAGKTEPIPVSIERLPGGASYRVAERDKAASQGELYFTVPAGQYFVLGDNRDDSADSRYTTIGYVPLELILGRVVWQSPSF